MIQKHTTCFLMLPSQRLSGLGGERDLQDKYMIEHLPFSCHVEVRDMLREMGHLTVPPPGTPPAPDIVYTPPSGKDLAIRIIMPTATTVNLPHRQLASSISVTRLLEAAGWTVVEVCPSPLPDFLPNT
jgi:hypothetical protein